ncbi:MAG: MBL fold metallo-hydrolase [candidate division Zixibacteria bacterium SM23_73_3]|nr:MAG: MBL fold metallo-hydrolase [candidate division Zixibacteria bacterium SM23_73_3]
MKIKFLGATKSVTGSMHLLESNGKRILIDCGFFQGRREESNRRNRNFAFDPKSIERVVLSHAHIDHSGNLPNLVKQGYQNSIYSTFATRDLCVAMLKDSAYIQNKDAEYLNKRKEHQGLAPIEPLYDIDDVEKALSLFRGIGYRKGFYVSADIKLTFYDAGHILGSALSVCDIKENGRNLRLAYIVDLGRKNLPILRDPDMVRDIHFMIIESTYGNRLHEDMSGTVKKLARVVKETVQRSGKIIIPAFSLGRTQEVVYCLNRLQSQKKIPAIKIFVDSPLAVNVTEIFKLHPECFDKEINRMIALNGNPFGWENITYVKDVESSKKLNKMDEPCIIISASGMCEAGRILHHLKNNIEDSKNTILVVGFMAKDTLGRRIVQKKEKVKIFGEQYRLRARVEVFDEFSAHADREELLEYVNNTKDSLEGVFVVHGEEKQSQALAEGIKDLGIKNVLVPDLEEEVTI